MYIWNDNTNKWAGVITELNSSIQTLYMTNSSVKISKSDSGTFIAFGKKVIGKTPFLGNWLFGLFSALVTKMGVLILLRKKKEIKY